MRRIQASALLPLSLCLFLATAAQADMRGGGLYYGWSWPSGLFGMKSLEMSVRFDNDPTTSDVLFFSTELFCGTPKLRNTFYFGIQTNVQGRGKGLIYSRFGTLDPADAEIPNTPEAWSVSSSTEGGFVGVRRLYNWTAAPYILRIAQVRDDSIGRWYGFWLIDPVHGVNSYAGALRFPKDADGVYPLIMVEGFGSFIEHANAVPAAQSVPLWEVSVDRPLGDDRTIAATSAHWWYALPTDAWQNSDMWAEGETIHAVMGSNTVRVHDPSTLTYSRYQPPRHRSARH
jgi:hypothetical protein